jgi:hypothetical protein
MRHRADAEFWNCYDQLPEVVRERADKAFQLLKADPRHPSLHLKKVGSRWSVRVDRGYRALALETTDGFLWIWIGSHDAYIREVGK